MKKWMSGLLALILTLTVCAGCGEKPSNEDGSGTPTPTGLYYGITGIDPAATVMTVDGNEISAELYFYWVAYNCSSLEYEITMYNAYAGLYSELIGEDGKLLWNAGFTDNMTLGQYAVSQAERTIQFYAVVENVAKRHGITLTQEDETALDEYFAATAEQAGGEEVFLENLELMGITQDTFRYVTASSYLYNHLVELVQQEGSELYLPLEDYRQYGAYADHILLMTRNAETGEALSEEEAAAKRQTAEDLLAQLQAAEDVESLFAQLADEYSEDTGRASYPDGYLFGKGEMVQSFEDAAFALEPGQLSGIVESDYGFHIILGKDLLSKLEEAPEQKEQLAGDYLSQLLEKEMDASQVTYNSDLLDGFDPGAFYSKYTETVEARQAEKKAQENDGAGDEDATPEGEDAAPEDGQ